MPRISATTLALLGFTLGACGQGPRSEPDSPSARPGLPTLCRRAGDDTVRDVFCGEQAPEIRSLRDLQAQLDLGFDSRVDRPWEHAPSTTHESPWRQLSVVLLNTSTALSGRLVSTLNPRAITLGPRATLAFNRGVQQVELISRDRIDERLKFYLVRFTQACNASDTGCTPADLFTPRIESDWERVHIEDDAALANTPSDCRQCHQRAQGAPILLMRELRGPWTHFFGPIDYLARPGPEPTGVHITRAYREGKGEEPYAGVPWQAIRNSIGFSLQNAVELPQPLVFDGEQVLQERWPPDEQQRFAEAPVKSALWYGHYEAFKRGEQLAMPHFDPFPSDPDKLARLGEAYQRWLDGDLADDEFPDLADIYPDDGRTRAEIGFQTEPRATPAQTLVQACAPCHNDVLDQTLSRARFNVDLTRMGRAELDLAIARVSLPLDDPAHMPPREFRQLDPGALEPLRAFLAADSRPEDDDALLRRAAELGMSSPVSGDRDPPPDALTQ